METIKREGFDFLSEIAIFPRATADALEAGKHFGLIGIHRVCQQMLTKLDAMHQGVENTLEDFPLTVPAIHGDIKPQNFVVSMGWQGENAFPAATYLIDQLTCRKPFHSWEG